MPLILNPEAYAEWLDPDNKESAKIEELLKTNYVKERYYKHVASLPHPAR
jgi:hypothetical protein